MYITRYLDMCQDTHISLYWTLPLLVDNHSSALPAGRSYCGRDGAPGYADARRDFGGFHSHGG